MYIINSDTSWEYTYTGYFNGKPCRVIEEHHIILPRERRTASEFVQTEEFKALTEAGFDVHSGPYS